MDNKSFNDALTGGIYPILKIDIDGEIGAGNNTATYILEQIDRVKPRVIIVEIRSTGGLSEDAIEIYETLKDAVNSGIIVKTFCYGYVASAATIVAQGASKGERHISNESMYLIHRNYIEKRLNAVDCIEASKRLKDLDNRVIRIYEENQAIPSLEGSVKILMDENGGDGKWLSPNEVIAFHLADEISEVSKEMVVTEIIRPIESRPYLVSAILVLWTILGALSPSTCWWDKLVIIGLGCFSVSTILYLARALKATK